MSPASPCQYCSECGNALSAGAKFCSSCGFTVAKIPSEAMGPVQDAPAPSTRLVIAPPPGVTESNPTTPKGKGVAGSVAPDDRAVKIAIGTRARLWRRVLYVACFFVVALIVVLVANAKFTGTNSPFLHSMDGTYVSADGGVQVTLKISGWSATMTMPEGYTVEGMIVERTGNTLRFSDGEVYRNGYIVPGQAWLHRGSKVDLATIGDDGQSILMQISGGTSQKLIRQ